MSLLFLFRSRYGELIDPFLPRRPKAPIYYEPIKKRKRLKKKKKEEILSEIIHSKEIPRARLPEVPDLPEHEERPDIPELSKIRFLINLLLEDILEQERAFKAAQFIISQEEKRLAQEELALLQQREQFLQASLKELNARLQQNDDEELLMFLLA